MSDSDEHDRLSPASLAGLDGLPLVMERARRVRPSARVEEQRRDETAEQEIYYGSAPAALREQLEKIPAADRRMNRNME